MEEKINYEHGSSTESVFSGFGSSSGLNTPAGSDLDSIESEQDDFMAELTRKMAENMLLEDDNKTSPVSDNTAKCYQNQHQKKARFQHQPRNREYGYAHATRPGFVSAAQAGSGMRVVFLGSKNESSGTGVFLPSQATNSNTINSPYDHQYRKKPAVCSTVLVPERVLQTLKQHFEKKRSDANGGMRSHTQQNQRLQSHENNNQELQLPQEWTY